MSADDLTLDEHGPLDEHGRLLHEDDLVAQLALSMARLEEALAEEGLGTRDLAELTVRTTEPEALGSALDVVEERLGRAPGRPRLRVEPVPGLAVPGMLVGLTGRLRPRTLMVVVAHPDDEAFGCGSVLAHASAHGLASVVVCATRGELGEPAPGSGVDPDRLPRVREAELRRACQLLGVGRVELLDYTDSGVAGDPAPGSLAAADPAELRDRVARLLDDVRPEVVVTLDASDGHRDHAAMRDATLAALDRAAHRPRRTYLFCLARSLMTEFTGDPTLGTPAEQITTLVDVSAHLDRRWQAIRTHASQVPPFDAMGPELQRGFLAVDRLRRVDPPWPGGPVETTWLPQVAAPR
ncbi:PIG-L family deacetylase [Nocardioides donggukensis]|uniref:PIG-L family deacetylase n=1 Tax=Nocardioides donggukensis TaxID=2774019 RepID=A0A927Q2M2_9ACTN|nr:PIG-L family deacetylase [Nocardioides donggukensis]MBD8870524.1 PIG-L family deacetylase [Nocardioides donggukensis]